MIDAIVAFAILCIMIGIGGFLWNASIAVRLRPARPGAPGKSRGSARVHELQATDRQLYERAQTLVKENRVSDAARILEELGLAREAAAILERAGLVHESAGVFLRRKRYHRAGEVYARHRMWEQAGHSYLLASGNVDVVGRSAPAGFRNAGAKSEGAGEGMDEGMDEAS